MKSNLPIIDMRTPEAIARGDELIWRYKTMGEILVEEIQKNQKERDLIDLQNHREPNNQEIKHYGTAI